MPADSQGREPRSGRPRGGRGGTRRAPGPRRAFPPPDRADPPARPAGPPLPPEAQPELLPRGVQRALGTLTPELAQLTGRHLAAAGLLVDDDPARAVAHARFAKQRAPRLAETREALGVAAYASGDYALARTELRAARRMSGAPELIPLLADCERALGRPDAALELAAGAEASRLRREDRIELAMVVSGARLDLGQAAQAVAVLALPELDAADESVAASPTILRLWYAYASALEAAGRHEEAAERLARVADLDDEELTDAAERLEGAGERPAPG